MKDLVLNKSSSVKTLDDTRSILQIFRGHLTAVMNSLKYNMKTEEGDNKMLVQTETLSNK